MGFCRPFAWFAARGDPVVVRLVEALEVVRVIASGSVGSEPVEVVDDVGGRSGGEW